MTDDVVVPGPWATDPHQPGELDEAALATPQAGGNGGNDGMDAEERITKLETHFEYVRRDLDHIRSDQKSILAKLDGIATELIRKPTAGQFWTMVATVAAVSLAVIAIFVGVLTYLQTL